MIAAVALLLLLLLAAPAQAADATGFQADAARDGLSAEPGLQPPLGRRWARNLRHYLGYPVITDGVVAVVTWTSDSTEVIGLATTNGATLWTRTYDGPPETGIAADDGRVFVRDFKGVLHALSARTGMELWAVQLPGIFTYPGTPPPTVDGDLVHVVSTEALTTLRQDTGAVLGQETFAEGDGRAGPVSDGTRVYIGGTRCRAAAYLRAGGVPGTGLPLGGAGPSAALWNSGAGTCTSIGNVESLAVHDGTLYLGAGVNGFALDAAGGNALGPYTAAGSPVFSGGVGLFRRNGLEAVELSTGRVIWRSASAVVPPLIVGNTVWAGMQDGMLRALSLLDGRVTFEREVPTVFGYGPPQGPLTGFAAGGGLLVVPDGEWLIAYGEGADAPGNAPGGAAPLPALRLRAKAKEVEWSERATLTLSSSSGQRRPIAGVVEVQVDHAPFNGFETERRFTPSRPEDSREISVATGTNTIVRAVVPGTDAESVTVSIAARLGYSFRLMTRRDRSLVLRAAVTGPPQARLGGRRAFLYRSTRGKRGPFRRIGTFRLRGSKTSASARYTFRVSKPRRGDYYFYCLQEKRNDGVGYFADDRTCGR